MTFYSDKNIEICHQKIIDDICENKYNQKHIIDKIFNRQFYKEPNTTAFGLKYSENDKKLLRENLQKYKIIGCKFDIITKIVEEGSLNRETNMYIHYINIHGDLFTTNLNIYNRNFHHTIRVEDIIERPFYIYHEHCNYNTVIGGSASSNYQIKHDYIEKSFLIPPYILNILLLTDFINDKCFNISYNRNTPSNEIKKRNIAYKSYINNIYIKYLEYINNDTLSENDKKYNAILYHTNDCFLYYFQQLDSINKKEINNYFDNIDKQKQDEIDRISKQKQVEIDRISKQKQDEIDSTKFKISIVNNILTIENNTNKDINLTDYLPYKIKQITDENGNIKNIRYTEITNIIFINCLLISISKYYTGITNLIFKNCPNFENNISRYLKADLIYLEINDKIIINYIKNEINKIDDYETDTTYSSDITEISNSSIASKISYKNQTNYDKKKVINRVNDNIFRQNKLSNENTLQNSIQNLLKNVSNENARQIQNIKQQIRHIQERPQIRYVQQKPQRPQIRHIHHTIKYIVPKSNQPRIQVQKPLPKKKIQNSLPKKKLKNPIHKK
jgi:hypothetical protein